jgi:hypothetical protein
MTTKGAPSALLCLWILVALAAWPIAPVRAQSGAGDAPEHAEPRESVDFSLRGAAGLGGGSAGIAGRLGFATEAWFDEVFGAGLDFARTSASERLVFAKGTDASFTLLSLSVRARSSVSGNYLMGGLGVGIADVELKHHPGCPFRLFEGIGQCAVTRDQYDGYLLAAHAAYLLHWDPMPSFSLGVVGRLSSFL